MMTILERLKELEAKVTPGPWEIDKEDVGDEEFIYIPTGITGGNGKRVVGSVGGLCSEDCDLGEGELEANAELITLLRNNLPVLLEVVEALEMVVDQLESPEREVAINALAKLEAPDA